MDKKQEQKINPLLIKDANYVLFNLVLNSVAMYFIAAKMSEGNLSKILIFLTIGCAILGIVIGLIICAGWIVAICTNNVIYIEQKQPKKGDQDGSNSN